MNLVYKDLSSIYDDLCNYNDENQHMDSKSRVLKSQTQLPLEPGACDLKSQSGVPSWLRY